VLPHAKLDQGLILKDAGFSEQDFFGGKKKGKL